VLATVAVGCGEPEPSGVPLPPTPPPSTSYRAIELERYGSLAGVLRWVGEAPAPAPLPVVVHREACGPQTSPALEVDDLGGVAHAVVSLEDVRVGRAFELPDRPPLMNRVGCRFEPHVLTVGGGWPVRFRSSDPVIHNVHGFRSDGSTWVDAALPEAGSELLRVVPRSPQALRIVCDSAHPWALGWIHVFEHPYHAVTGRDGRYRIDGIPEGTYRVRLWHEGFQTRGEDADGRPRYSAPIILTRTVSISPQQETSADFTLDAQSARQAGD
jgi:hypothetical protein